MTVWFHEALELAVKATWFRKSPDLHKSEKRRESRQDHPSFKRQTVNALITRYIHYELKGTNWDQT